MLTYTGYPLVDVGAATVAAFNNKSNLAAVVTEDLDRVAAFIAEHYVHDPLRSFLTTIFPNAGYVNPTMGADKRAQEIQRSLYSYKVDVSQAQSSCVFCGQPAGNTVFRQHIPLVTGEGIMNFGPSGKIGLDVCGVCLLCIQAFPLGSMTRCSGRVLLVHSDDPSLTYRFAKLFLQQNRQALTLTGGDSGAKSSFPRTIIVEALFQADKEQQDGDDADVRSSLAAYHVTNYGTNADVDIYQLPSNVLAFLRTARSTNYREAWMALVARAWEQPRLPKQTQVTSGVSGLQTPDSKARGERLGARRNFLYEDLFGYPLDAKRIIRRHLLRFIQVNTITKQEDADKRGVTGVSGLWPLTELFLRKVVQMDRLRIDTIREVGDRLAIYINQENDSRFVKELYGKSLTGAGYRALRTALVKVSTQQVKAGKPPLISYDDFVTIFEEGEDAPRIDWALARDLLYMRVLDRLYEHNYFHHHQELVQEIAERAEEVSATAEESIAG